MNRYEMDLGLHNLATRESVEYALSRAYTVEGKYPLLSLIYRVVAEVLNNEIERQQAFEERENPAA